MRLVLCFLFILVKALDEVKIILSHCSEASTTCGSNLRGDSLVDLAFDEVPSVSSADELLVVTTARPRSVVWACRLPSIQQPHSSQDKQSLQLSSAIKGTSYWRIKRRAMTRVFVLLQESELVKRFVCLSVSLNIIISLHVALRAELPGKTAFFDWGSFYKLKLLRFCHLVSEEQMKKAQRRHWGAQTSVLKGPWDLKD